VCLCAVILTIAARRAYARKNLMYLAEFWVFAYAREAKVGLTEQFFCGRRPNPKTVTTTDLLPEVDV